MAGVWCLAHLQLPPQLLLLQAAQHGLQAAQAGSLLQETQLLRRCPWAPELLLMGLGCRLGFGLVKPQQLLAAWRLRWQLPVRGKPQAAAPAGQMRQPEAVLGARCLGCWLMQARQAVPRRGSRG